MDDPKTPVGSHVSVDQDKLLYNHGIFDKELRASRKLLVPTLVLPLIYNSLLLWLCLSLYWGSLLYNDLNKLTVYAIDLDGGSLGQQMIQGLQAFDAVPGSHLNWQFDQTTRTDAASRDLVVSERTWGVVQVRPGASSNLTTGLMTGNTDYNALAAVTIYVASARAQITVSSKVVPAILAAINPILGKANAIASSTFLSSHLSNSSALGTALKCKGCLSNAYGFTQVDLIPFDKNVATGSVLTGMIFLLTFTFSVFQVLRLNGELFGAQLSLTAALTFRTVAALFAYLIMSLWYSLTNIAFGVPTDRVWPHGRGFMIFWMLNFCTMAALGLPMESLFTVIGLKWSGYFLSFWVIVNVAGGFGSFETMPAFYQYGYAFPFFNSIQGARTIIFGTKNHLGRNFGVLIAWMVIGLAGVFVFTARMLQQNQKNRKHAVR